jgi:hypothetical protein
MELNMPEIGGGESALPAPTVAVPAAPQAGPSVPTVVVPAVPQAGPAAQAATAPQDLSHDEIELRRKAARLASAESIQPGCRMHDLATWAPREKKPQIGDLKTVMQARFPHVRCKAWEAQKMASYLFEHAIPEVLQTRTMMLYDIV